MLDPAATDKTAFQSTPPARGATSGAPALIRRRKFQSTPPARGATCGQAIKWGCEDISIHAPREGGDRADRLLGIGDRGISIHAPREGGDCGIASTIVVMISDFNPRPPRGGRPKAGTSPARRAYDFNPRPPRGGRLLPEKPHRQGLPHFNPRPPRGGRLSASRTASRHSAFQSTPPARGATPARLPQPLPARPISIHAPREGGDF